MIVIDLGNMNCKLQFIITFHESVPHKVFLDPDVAQILADRACYSYGYFGSALKEKGFFLKEVEFVVPPIAAYLELERRIKEGLPENLQGAVAVKKGIGISLPQLLEEDEHISAIFDEEMKRFTMGNAQSN